MRQIRNITKTVDDGKPHLRELEKLEKIAVHRVGYDHPTGTWLGKNAVEICKRFVKDPAIARYTGGEVPYTFIIGQRGEVWQCLPLSDAGRHARRWNSVAIGVALVGDFRFFKPTPSQHRAAVWLCSLLCWALGFDPAKAVAGHDELPGGRKDKSKRCPGENLPMDVFRAEVSKTSPRPLERLRQVGLVI